MNSKKAAMLTQNDVLYRKLLIMMYNDNHKGGISYEFRRNKKRVRSIEY